MFTFIRAATSKTIMLMVLDSSTGLPKTGMLFSDVATAAYVKNGAAAVTFSAVTLATPSTPWVSGGFKEIDATNMPGLYRLDIPNAAISGTPETVAVYLTFTPANTDAQPVIMQLNHQDLTDWALEVDTIPELVQGVPDALPTIKRAIMLVYMALRNKTISSPTEFKIHNDAGTVITKAADAFTTEFTRDKLVSGP